MSMTQNRTVECRDNGHCQTLHAVSERRTHPRIHVHFTPTFASWLKMVERFFRDITDKCIRRGVIHNVPDLEEAVLDYIEIQNEDPAPFIWTAKACDILEKVKRGRARLDNLQSA